MSSQRTQRTKYKYQRTRIFGYVQRIQRTQQMESFFYLADTDLAAILDLAFYLKEPLILGQQLAISVLQPLNFHLAMPNYDNKRLNCLLELTGKEKGERLHSQCSVCCKLTHFLSQFSGSAMLGTQSNLCLNHSLSTSYFENAKTFCDTIPLKIIQNENNFFTSEQHTTFTFKITYYNGKKIKINNNTPKGSAVFSLAKINSCMICESQ